MKENGPTQKKARSRVCTIEIITDADHADDLVLLANTSQISVYMEQSAGGFGLYVNSDKTKFICFKQDGAIFTLNG